MRYGPAVGGRRDGELAGDLSLEVGRVAAPLREQVLAVLRRAIVEQRFRPGHHLVERELVEQVGVSRTTIREVLRQLDAEGLVASIPNKGTVVAVPTVEEAVELYEIRSALESLAARSFVERASGDQVRELRAAFREIERVVREAGGARALLAAKDGFYDVLLEGAGNRSVRSILARLHARVSLLRTTSLSQPGRPAEAVRELRTIVRAIEARDGEGAARACARHVERASEAGLAGLAGADGATRAA